MRPSFKLPAGEFMNQMSRLYLPVVWRDMVTIAVSIIRAARAGDYPDIPQPPEITWMCLDLGKQIHFLEIEYKLRGRK